MSQIIAIHGQLGMTCDWDYFAKIASKAQHDLEVIDLWSFLVNKELSLKDFGSTLNKHSDSKSDVLLGYSMGGRLALHALLANPSRWKAAVIVSAHLGLVDDDAKIERRKEDDKWSKKVWELEWSDFWAQWNSQSVLSTGKIEPKDRRKLKLYTKEISRAFKCWSLAEQEDLLPQLVEIDVPILFVTGEKDKKFYNHLTSAVKSLNRPNIKILSVPGAGHRVPWEDEDFFANQCLDWIDLQN